LRIAGVKLDHSSRPEPCHFKPGIAVLFGQLDASEHRCWPLLSSYRHNFHNRFDYFWRRLRNCFRSADIAEVLPWNPASHRPESDRVAAGLKEGHPNFLVVVME